MLAQKHGVADGLKLEGRLTSEGDESRVLKVRWRWFIVYIYALFFSSFARVIHHLQHFYQVSHTL